MTNKENVFNKEDFMKELNWDEPLQYHSNDGKLNERVFHVTPEICLNNDRPYRELYVKFTVDEYDYLVKSKIYSDTSIGKGFRLTNVSEPVKTIQQPIEKVTNGKPTQDN